MTAAQRSKRARLAARARWKGHDTRNIRDFSLATFLSERPLPMVLPFPPGDPAQYFFEHPPGDDGVILTHPDRIIIVRQRLRDAKRIRRGHVRSGLASGKSTRMNVERFLEARGVRDAKRTRAGVRRLVA